MKKEGLTPSSTNVACYYGTSRLSPLLADLVEGILVAPAAGLSEA